MSRRGNKVRAGRMGGKVLLRTAGLLPLVVALPLLAGCPPAHHHEIQQGGDPLLHEQYRKGTNPINPTTTQTRSPGPASSAVDTSMSSAALATGVLPDSRPLNIPSPDGQSTGKSDPARSPWTVPGAGPVQPILSKPVPIDSQSKANPQRT